MRQGYNEHIIYKGDLRRHNAMVWGKRHGSCWIISASLWEGWIDKHSVNSFFCFISEMLPDYLLLARLVIHNGYEITVTVSISPSRLSNHGYFVVSHRNHFPVIRVFEVQCFYKFSIEINKYFLNNVACDISIVYHFACNTKHFGIIFPVCGFKITQNSIFTFILYCARSDFLQLTLTLTGLSTLSGR